jgi:carotenoid cleavage dioxygenase-like enzyme
MTFISMKLEIFDISVNRTNHFFPQMYLSKLRENKFDVKDPSKLLRYIIPISASSPSKEKIVLDPITVCPEVGCEHPSINPEFRGKPYKYAYVTG